MPQDAININTARSTIPYVTARYIIIRTEYIAYLSEQQLHYKDNLLCLRRLQEIQSYWSE